MMENGYPGYLESRTPRFAYDFGNVFERLCEDLAPVSARPGVSVATRQCVGKEDEVLEDVWRLFDTSGGRPSQPLRRDLIILPNRCGTALGIQIQVIEEIRTQIQQEPREEKDRRGSWLRTKFGSRDGKGARMGLRKILGPRKWEGGTGMSKVIVSAF
jgi:hypothetical protein